MVRMVGGTRSLVPGGVPIFFIFLFGECVSLYVRTWYVSATIMVVYS